MLFDFDQLREILFGDSDIEAFDEPAVCWDGLALFELNDVADRQLAAHDLFSLVLADHYAELIAHLLVALGPLVAEVQFLQGTKEPVHEADCHQEEALLHFSAEFAEGSLQGEENSDENRRVYVRLIE